MVSQAQEKCINASFSDITKVSVNSTTRRESILTHLARSKVMSYYSFYQFYLFGTKSQPSQYIRRYDCPLLSMP